MVPDDRRTITATEAHHLLGIPTGTIRAWASTRKLVAVSIGPDQQRWYLLREVLDAAAQRKPRATHARPTRRRLTTGAADIA